ncbi:M20 family metallo-hydrolase [Litchfieldella rifensis]|uniref:M20 family metallo-hydrolase n=1 Tax=Litchfieldella rifensis TaxID=762643 RepID=A0ABV7LT36_9GAMM
MLGQEILRRLDQAGDCSWPGPGVTRTFCSDEHRRVLPLIEHWMHRAGLAAELDAAGNLVGRCPRAQSGEPTLILGSHQDTVVEGGKYDGMLGVVLPLVALEALANRGTTLPYGIEVVAFGDEEGTRFQSTLVGSKALAGDFDHAMLEARDAEDVSMRDALRDFGGDPEAIDGLAREASRTLGFVEVHIEQGPLLEQRALPVGVVTAITGIERHRVTVIGKAGHAGTTPMAGRRDALVGAAWMVVEVDRLLNEIEDFVGVVGKLEVRPNAVNVIPAAVEFTLELRSPQGEIRQQGARQVMDAVTDIARERGLALDIECTYRAEGVPCAEWIIAALERASEGCGQPPFRLFSGAGHDGLAMHSLTDIGMLFVRCRDGLSHHPDEAISAADAEVAAQVLMRFLEDLPATLEARG